MSTWEELDFFSDKALVNDPYPYYDALRQCPVRREPRYDVIMVSGYDEVSAVLRDERETFSLCNVVSGPFPGLPVAAEGDDISDLIEQYRDTLPLSDYFASFDPPKHTAHRSLLGRLFTPKRLKENEEFLWRLADQQIDRFVNRGSCEFVTDYGFPFTMIAIADLLGVPESDHEKFGREPKFTGLKGSDRNFVGVEDDWFVEYIEDRRREPRDDVLTHLAQAKFPDGSTPTALDVARVATFMFAAGQGTTVDLLSSALLMLAEGPDLQELLRCERDRIPGFFEEMLRFESPVKSNFRLARRSTTVSDVEAPAGSDVLVMVGAANRDPRRFEDPDDFRLDRPNALEHLGFGRGMHACPGAPLARAEARVSLERILDRMADIRLSEAEHGPPDDRRFKWERTFLLRRLKSLHLEFTPID
ncbi:MAG: cytochrome P450 [Acidimicrobiia bacterium]